MALVAPEFPFVAMTYTFILGRLSLQYLKGVNIRGIQHYLVQCGYLIESLRELGSEISGATPRTQEYRFRGLSFGLSYSLLQTNL